MLGTFVSYWPAMRNSFVWDDTALVLRDPLIRSWRLAPDAFREFLFLDATASNFYRPLQRLTYTADYALWGIERSGKASSKEKTGAPDTGDHADTAAVQDAAQPGWHFTSVLTHALAALALWWLLCVWFGANARWWPLAGALAWALHPLHTSAVTYVSGRADPLAAIFIFSGLALVAKAHARGAFVPGDRPAARGLIIAAVCALLALLSKENGVALLMLWLVWVLVRARRDPHGWLSWIAAATIAGGAYFALRITAGHTSPPAPAENAPWQVRPILVARALAEYTTLFLAPHSLHMERDVSTNPVSASNNPVGDYAANLRNGRMREAQTLGGLFIAAGLVWWWRRARRTAPDAALALACAAVTWLPVSNAIPLNATVAEHWLYVPSAFLLAAILFTARALAPAHAKSFALLRPVAALWLVFLAVETWRQQDYWRDQRTFVTATATRSGNGVRMMINLGQLAMQDGNPDEALALFRDAARLEPNLAIAHFNIATVALQRKDYDTTLAELKLAERSPLFRSEIDVIRASIDQARTGKPRFDLLASAASSAGRNWSIARRYPIALLVAGKTARAYEDVLRQLTGHPFRAESWHFLGQIADQMQQPAVAARAYAEAADRDVRDDFSRARLRELRASF
ncbi:MAG: tetratricopeptide repeat protein [Chthoniobacteraceae bacterium]